MDPDAINNSIDRDRLRAIARIIIFLTPRLAMTPRIETFTLKTFINPYSAGVSILVVRILEINPKTLMRRFDIVNIEKLRKTVLPA